MPKSSKSCKSAAAYPAAPPTRIVPVGTYEGKIFFNVEKKGIYMAITRKDLPEAIEGIYEGKGVASTFTYVKR
ncbi:hypothetical protein [Butyrivibrio sp. FCS014]|uniref:hypothetical protein n=1 Tax=Butyrivibrio sp. FCS014 TaxID=1408304 RepID=UPI0004AFDA0A|nr:hypothetical protein [Butyrivibrio sp. FCS014]